MAPTPAAAGHSNLIWTQRGLLLLFQQTKQANLTETCSDLLHYAPPYKVSDEKSDYFKLDLFIFTIKQN